MHPEHAFCENDVANLVKIYEIFLFRSYEITLDQQLYLFQIALNYLVLTSQLLPVSQKTHFLLNNFQEFIK